MPASMKSYEELERLWSGAEPSPVRRGILRGICLRRGGGRHELAEAGVLTVEGGLVGDRWQLAEDPERLCQITFMNATVAALVAHGDVPGHHAGDNFYVDLDLSEGALPVFARVRLGAALLEVTAEPHLGCGTFNQRFGAGALRWVNHQAHRPSRRRGVNLRVLQGGAVRVGDAIEVLAGEQ